MRNFSLNDIALQDDNGNRVVDPQKLFDVLEKYRQEIEKLEQRLQKAEHDIRNLQ